MTETGTRDDTTAGAGDDRDRSRRELAYLLRRHTVEVDRLSLEFGVRHGLNRTDVRALVVLLDADRAGEAVPAGRLAQRLSVTGASVTALVDRLARTGFLERVPDPADRRRVLLRPTGRTRALGWAFFGSLHTSLVEALQQLPDEDIAAASRVLAVMTGVVTRHDPVDVEPATGTDRPAGAP